MPSGRALSRPSTSLSAFLRFVTHHKSVRPGNNEGGRFPPSTLTFSVVTAAPVAAAPVTTAPAPMPAAPAPMTTTAPMTAPVAAAPAPMTAPAHLFRLQMFHLVPGGDSGTGILVRRRQPSVLRERMRHQRCGPCTRGQRGSARGKSKGEFQKMAAFHDIVLSVRASDAERVSSRADERSVNRGTLAAAARSSSPRSGSSFRGAREREPGISRQISSGFRVHRCAMPRNDELPHPGPNSSASTRISRVRVTSGQQRSHPATSGFSASPLVARSSAAWSGNS
jgi:hypothetical protein